MNHRLQQFLAAENISQAQFADSIDVARASVSHVLAGRNKPGYDFIRSIADHYPRLNLEWLISGKGKMYKHDAISSPAASLPPDPPASPRAGYSDELFGPESLEDEKPEEVAVKPAKPAPAPAPQPEPSPFRRSISRIIVFYDDNTYQELK